jgi:PAS domain S-box-containing protein
MPPRKNKSSASGVSASIVPDKINAGSRTMPQDDKLGTMFQTLVKNVFGVIMVTAQDGTIQYVTPSVKRVLGYDPVELFGKKAYNITHREDLKRIRRIMKSVGIDGSSSEPFDIKTRHWDGTYRICQTVVHKISHGLAFSFHDVTAQRRAEEALRRSEERYRKAFRCSPDSITISEMITGRFIEVNEGFEHMSGHSHDDVIGKSSLDIGLWRDPAARALVVKRLKRDGAVRDYETDFITRDGDILNCLVSAEWFELENKRCVVLIARDITERKQYEDELHHSSVELERERHELTEKNIALKQILDHIEQEKSEIRKELHLRLEKLLKPVVARLKKNNGTLHKKDIALLENGVNSIVGLDTDRYKDNLTKLTPRELDICDLIKKGYSSKEIAAFLSVSVQTVHKHRQVVRRKLQLNNQDVNLAAYLRLR